MRKIPDDEARGLFRKVKGNTYAISRFRKKVGEGTIKLNAQANPWEIDAMPSRPPGVKALLGIYEFDGEAHQLCFAQPGKARPKDFKAEKDTGNTLTIWEREKK